MTGSQRTPTAPVPNSPTALSAGDGGVYADAIPSATAFAVFYIAYMLSAAFGRWMMVIPDIPITVWPPNGVVLAMLLMQPRHTWPWWIAAGAAGEMTANFIWFGNPIVAALGYVTANGAAVAFAAFVLAPYVQATVRRVTALHQTLAFLSIGVLAAPIISATLGSAIDAFVGKNPFTTTWPIWWLGDATGILIATPLVMVAVNAWSEKARPNPAQVLEGAVIGAIIGGLSLWEIATGTAYDFLLFLPILWAALRFEFRGASLAVIGLALSIGIHVQNLGGIEVQAANVALHHARLQALLLVAASTGLIVAAITRQQRLAVTDLARINSELETRVWERTRAIEVAERRFKATFENAGVGISIVSGAGVLERVNESLAQMLGYEAAEMEGHSLDRFTHADDVAKNEAAWDRLRKGTAEEYELEKRYMRKDGEVVWGHTTVSCVRHPDGQIAYLIKIIQDITARRNSEEARQLLMRELNHRSKNLLTIVQVIARQTAARTPQDFISTFNERLRALSANQDLLVNSNWHRVALTELLHSQLEHICPVGPRVALSGPPIMVPPSAAQALAMAIHELATNAAKHGSLSNHRGCVDIDWKFENGTFLMTWRETGGPKVVQPATQGFGTTVLERMTASSMSGEVTIDYAPEGLVWRLTCPASMLQDAQEPAT